MRNTYRVTPDYGYRPVWSGIVNDEWFFEPYGNHPRIIYLPRSRKHL